MMRALVRDARAGAEPLSTAGLCTTIAAYAGDEVAQGVQRIVQGGALPVLDPQTFGPCAILREASRVGFDLGFDQPASQQDGVARGVREGGPAWNAGLREGVQVVGYSIHFGDVSRPVEVVVREAGAERTLRWSPAGEEYALPQLELLPGAAEDCHL